MSAILDALDYLGSSIDKPGRAVRGMLSGNMREGMAALPFSDTFGLTDPTQAVSGSDLIRQAGLSTGSSFGDSALGFGAELALDPTTYLGGALGRMGGRMLGRGLDTAAQLRGPGYATHAEDLLSQIGKLSPDVQDATRFRIEDIAKRAPAAFGEIPQGSQLIGAGAEGLAARTPMGDVVRVGSVFPGTKGRPIDEGVLQATRAIDFPASENIAVRAERLPLAADVGNENYWRSLADPGGMISRQRQTQEGLQARGLDFWDRKPENLGRVGWRDLVIDPGAVDALPGFTGGFQPVGQAGRPSLLMRALLDAMGGQGAMRRAIDAGRAAPGYERSLGRTGMLAGGLGLGAMN